MRYSFVPDDEEWDGRNVSFPPAVIPSGHRDEETKTTCPKCKGSGKKSMTKFGPSMYSFVACELCDGEGMCTASKAKDFTSGVYKCTS